MNKKRKNILLIFITFVFMIIVLLSTPLKAGIESRGNFHFINKDNNRMDFIFIPKE